MNLSRFLPGLIKGDDKPSEEELDLLDAEAKADRIRFTRERVRNGPWGQGRSHNRRPLDSRFHTQGQADRAYRRANKVLTRRANVKARRDWMRAHQDLSRLRGQLEVVANPESPLYEAAMRGLFDGYGPAVAPELPIIGHTGGPEDDDRQPIYEALDFHNQQHRSLVVQAALHHYKIATGQVTA